MGLMTGKKGIIFGVSNKHGIAYAIAQALHEQGAEIAFSYFGDLMRDRVTPLAEAMGAKLIQDCDATQPDQVDAFFDAYAKIYDGIDFVVHAVAFANRDDLRGDFSNVSVEGFELALRSSAYSLIPLARKAKPLMKEGGSIITLSYYGGEKTVANYNIMGVAKAALESTVRYLAVELGEQGVRVNTLSAGPIKTLAAKGIGGFEKILKVTENRAPLRRNVNLQDIGRAGLFLCSDLSSGVSGEVLHVDCGFHSVAASLEEAG